MAAEKPRPEKVAVVDEVRGRLSSSNAALLTEYRGLNVRALANLRNAVRDAGGEYKIYKNTLVRLAVADSGLTGLEELLTGPTAIVFVEGDAVLVAKSLRDFARTNANLVVKGGLLGTTVLSATDAGALADVAPREVLLAQIAGAFAAPLQQFAGLLAALPRNFAYGLKALIDQRGSAAPISTDGAPGDAAPAAEPAAAEPAATAEVPADAPTADAPAPSAEAPADAPEVPADAPAPTAETADTAENAESKE